MILSGPRLTAIFFAIASILLQQYSKKTKYLLRAAHTDLNFKKKRHCFFYKEGDL